MAPQSRGTLTLWLSLVAAVEKALGGHPPDAAQLTVNSPDLSIAIHPRRDGAADIELGFNGIDEVYLEVGLTDTCLWQVNATPLDETVYRVVAVVAAGKLEEAGSFDATARIQTPQGELRFGATKLLPIPWSWRRRRTYAAYS